jgi:hypothetical protein
MVLIEANIYLFFFKRVLVFQRRKRMNSVGRGPLGLNRFGREKTEPN